MNVGERIKRARISKNISLASLGDAVGVSHTAIDKYEKGENKPDSEMLLKLARALNITHIEYFFRPTTASFEPSFRKKASLPKKVQNSIVEEIQEQAERRIELENLLQFSEFKLPESLEGIEISSIEQIEDIAVSVRSDWDLGLSPIESMVDVLEDHGILVFFFCGPEDAKMDGLAGSIDGRHVVAVSTTTPGDRERFTLAHELGHILLDELLEGREEKEIEQFVNRFAGAFLYPKDKVIEAFGEFRKKVSIAEVLEIKKHQKMSMLAIVFRLSDCDVIQKSHLRWWFIRSNKEKWAKGGEPGGNDVVPHETGTKFIRIVHRALAEELISQSKAAELLGKSLAEFRQEWADLNDFENASN